MIKQSILNQPWQLFVTRPATLLERSLRCPGYHRAGLKTIFVISERSLCEIYVNKNEWNQLENKAVKLYIADGKSRLQRYKLRLNNARKFAQAFKRIKKLSLNDVKKMFNYYALITEIIVVTHQLEKGVDTNNDLKKYRAVVGYLHDNARRIIDLFYEIYLSQVKQDKFAWYLPTEIVSRQEVNVHTLAERKNKYVLFSNQRSLELLTGNKASGFIHRLRSKEKNNSTLNSKNIRGVSASGGKVTGEVLLVRYYDDLKKLVANQIVISHMTEPRMNHYLIKAKAIVTDEGGLTSHAAIFAREIKKPCVVGTKFATKIFKDGDMVEVDANNGVVRKIK